MPRKSAIGKLASKKTKTKFAEELSSYTTLTAKEIETLFPKKGDRNEFVELMKIVNSAAKDNTKKAELVKKIGKVSGAVVSVARKFATGL